MYYDDQSREQHLRQVAFGHGLALKKTDSEDPRYRVYFLVEGDSVSQTCFALNLDGVERFLAELAAEVATV